MYHHLFNGVSYIGQGSIFGSLADRARLGLAARFASVLLLATLTAAAAQISVPLPFTPVPFTFQPVLVLVGGAALGSRLGAASQVVYLTAAIVGLPVLAFSTALPPGAARLLGPTGGYLMAYPFAAFLAGWLSERGFDRHYLTSLLAMTAGLLVVFTGGVAWLAFLQPIPIGIDQALRAGLYPFLVLDLLKLVVAASILPTLWRLVGPRPSQQF